MARLTFFLLAVLTATTCHAQVTYKSLTIHGTPTGAGAVVLDNNFSTLADAAPSYFSQAGPPDANDDSAGTGGTAAWVNTQMLDTVTDRLYICKDATPTAANWQVMGDLMSSVAASTYATQALDNLTGVAINTALLPDADSMHDLGSGSFSWDDVFATGTGTFGTVAADYIDLTAGLSAPAHEEGRIFYDDDEKTLSVHGAEPTAPQRLGRVFERATNKTGAQIDTGELVYVDGAQGQQPTIALAKADVSATCRLIGVAAHNIADNATGSVTVTGGIDNIDTSAWVAGTTVYLSATTAGELTSTAPTAPSYVISVGMVTNQHATEGSVLVNIIHADVCGTVVIQNLDVNTDLDVAANTSILGTLGVGTATPGAPLGILNPTAFSLTETTDGILLDSMGASAGEGNYGASIGLTRVLGDVTRRQAAIAVKQTGSDNDATGLAFFTHDGVGSDDTLAERMLIANDGVVTTAGLLAPESFGSAQVKVVQPGGDPQAVIDAITDATTSKPYTVHIPGGVWTLTSTLAMKDNISIRGDGAGVTIITHEVDNSGDSVQEGTIGLADNVTISDMTIQATQVVMDDAAVGCISTGDNDDVRIERVQWDVVWDTVFIQHESNTVTVIDCYGTTEYDGYSAVEAGGFSCDNTTWKIWNDHTTRVGSQNFAHQGFIWTNETTVTFHAYNCLWDGSPGTNYILPAAIKNSGTMHLYNCRVDYTATNAATGALGYVSNDPAASVTFYGGSIEVTGGTDQELFAAVGTIVTNGLVYELANISGSGTLDGVGYESGTTQIGDLTGNKVEFSASGDQTFVGTAGLPYGEISVVGNVTADTIDTTKVQFARFDTDGESNNTTPSNGDDHITITTAGRYMVVLSISAQSDDAQSIVMDLSCWKNNGATELSNVHAHRSFAGGATSLGSISLSGIHNFAANDTLELWMEAQASRDVILSDVTMTVFQLGGGG